MKNNKKYVKVMFGTKSNAGNFKAMAGCAVRGYRKTALQIFQDKVNTKNVDLALAEFIDFCKPRNAEKFDENSLGTHTRKIYELLLQMKNN